MTREGGESREEGGDRGERKRKRRDMLKREGMREEKKRERKKDRGEGNKEERERRKTKDRKEGGGRVVE